ncbi:MAG TPA: ABC transporter ATP-binding protein [Candidatus Nanoarchaeia archaeon]|nr:ABC transporter ATP-binding protein [Candidatus Nanoarchaeia archaeon]
MVALMTVDDVHKIYPFAAGDVHAVDGISLKIEKGDFVALIGPSGSGKTTAMNLLGCLDTPSTGKIFLGEHDIQHLAESDLAQVRGKKIGFIFQTFNLIPSLTALENIALPLLFQNVSRAVRMKKAREFADQLGIGDRVDHFPNQLSGGQRQRVAIARALVNDPDIILADEPTGNLDTKTGAEVMSILAELNKQGKTIILVTHNLELTKIANKVIRMRDGKIAR